MQTVYLHLGLHKTATKFLQTDIFPKLERCYYVDKAQYERRVVDPLLHSDYQTFLQNRDELRTILMANTDGAERVIISNELFSGNPFFRYSTRHLCLLKLKTLFPEGKIILAIRGQRSMIDSLYREYVIQGGTKTIATFVTAQIPRDKSILAHDPSLDLQTFRYSPYLASICELFGQENLYVYAYEKLIKDDGAFLTELGSFLGETIDASEFSSEPRHRSLSDSYLRFLRLTNHFYQSAFHHAGVLRHRYNIGHLFRKLPFAKVNRQKSQGFDLDWPIDYTEDNDLIDKTYNLGLREQFSDYYYPGN